MPPPVPTRNYLYPTSYRGITGQTRKLSKGILFALKSVKGTLLTQGPNTNANDPYAVYLYPPSTSIDESVPAKEFQFNPPTMGLSIRGVPTLPAGTENPTGTTQSAVGMSIGQASSQLKLLFNREMEVYRSERSASAPQQSPGGRDAWARYGVQQDIFDVYNICLQGEDLGLAVDVSLRNVTSRIFDLAASGKSIAMKFIGIYYSPEFIVYAKVTNIEIEYIKFSANLVPTMAWVALTLDIYSVTNTTSPSLLGATSTTTTSTSGGTSSTTGAATPSSPASITREPSRSSSIGFIAI